MQHRPADPAAMLSAMTETMKNRGPDGHGCWTGPEALVGFAHRRLAILDPTAASDQPMHSADDALTIVFNGEIFNFRELRSQLAARGRVFRTTGDTEVLLHLYEVYGDAMTQMLRGMFAFALWDGRKQRLLIARDPLGIKPMYYSTEGGMLRFASQVKTLEPLLESRHADPAGRAGFLLWGSVPEPYTFFQEIRALPAGHRLVLERGGKPRIFAGPNVAEMLADAAAQPAPPSWERHAMLRKALCQSVEAHMISDVPVALFLSAGLDSATIAALVGELPDIHLKALTLGFDELRGTAADEVPLARKLAERYHIDFSTEIVDRHGFSEEYDSLIANMDQPTIDGVNVYFVSRMARRAGYKVALSGLGGDELFAGYPSFRQVPRMRRLLGWAAAVPQLGRGFRIVSSALLRRFTSPKFAGLLEYGHSLQGSYLLRRGLYLPWELPSVMDPEMAAAGLNELQYHSTVGRQMEILDRVQADDRVRLTALEMSLYMRNQLLRDADWAGMANSVEIRVPLVDAELLRQVAPLLMHGMAPGKREMASTPGQPLPAEILNRPKTGFSVPVREWLAAGHARMPERGLRGWARHLEATFA